MRRLIIYFLALSATWFISACEYPDIVYPVACNPIEEEIDDLLTRAEDTLFTGDFREGLFHIGRVERLLPLTQDAEDHRNLRYLFAKALLVTCEEGESSSSQVQFQNFIRLLDTKGCNASREKEVEENEQWQIVGEEIVSVAECTERIDSIEEKIEDLFSLLPVPVTVHFVIRTVIRVIADAAKLCCGKNGFWKTCIQPVINSWKRTQHLSSRAKPS